MMGFLVLILYQQASFQVVAAVNFQFNTIHSHVASHEVIVLREVIHSNNSLLDRLVDETDPTNKRILERASKCEGLPHVALTAQDHLVHFLAQNQKIFTWRFPSILESHCLQLLLRTVAAQEQQSEDL